MPKFPVDTPKRNVVKTFEILGFHIVREKGHISMVRENPDGSKTPLTMPNHPKIKASTLRTNGGLQTLAGQTALLAFSTDITLL